MIARNFDCRTSSRVERSDFDPRRLSERVGTMVGERSRKPIERFKDDAEGAMTGVRPGFFNSCRRRWAGQWLGRKRGCAGYRAGCFVLY